jgi:hypothetical protein
MDGLTDTTLEDVHMELHSCRSASIHGQVFARNVSHTRIQEPKRFTFPAPSVRCRLTTNFLNARGTIEAEPWRGVLLIVTARWITRSLGEGYISTVRHGICQSRVPTHTLYDNNNDENNSRLYLQQFTARSHEDQHTMDDRLRHLRHCILLAQ